MRELRWGGYEPDHERVDTPEAMEQALASAEWDVIISDYRMPRFSAPEALQIAHQSNPGVPFVVVSGKVGEGAAVEAMRAGAHDYVMKNNLARLCATVERGLQEAGERRGRKRIEEELRASEAELRALFEAMTDIVFVVDGEGRYLKIAPTNPSLLYRPPDELLGKTVHEVFVPEQADEFLGHIRRALETRRRVNFEYDLQIGRQKMWFDCAISPMLEDSVVVVVRDITERKRSEEALGESEERFRSAFESAAVGMALVGLDGSWLEANQTFSDIVGYSRQEMSSMSFQDITHPDDLRADLENMRRLLAGEIPSYQMEKRYIHKDGHVVWVLLTASLVRDTEGQPLYGIGQVLDITESKRTAEEIRQSEALYRAVIEQATENIFLVDVETLRIMESNPAFRSTLGYSEELKRMTLHDIVAADPEGVDENLRRVLELKNPFVGERKYRCKDGSLIDVEGSASVIVLDGKETLCAVAHDVTERARVQELLEERIDTLSRISADLTLDLPMAHIMNALARSVIRASTAVAC